MNIPFLKGSCRSLCEIKSENWKALVSPLPTLGTIAVTAIGIVYFIPETMASGVAAVVAVVAIALLILYGSCCLKRALPRRELEGLVQDLGQETHSLEEVVVNAGDQVRVLGDHVEAIARENVVFSGNVERVTNGLHEVADKTETVVTSNKELTPQLQAVKSDLLRVSGQFSESVQKLEEKCGELVSKIGDKDFQEMMEIISSCKNYPALLEEENQQLKEQMSAFEPMVGAFKTEADFIELLAHRESLYRERDEATTKSLDNIDDKLVEQSEKIERQIKNLISLINLIEEIVEKFDSMDDLEKVKTEIKERIRGVISFSPSPV